MLHLKGDKNSSHAALLQKTLARGRAAKASADTVQPNWSRAAQHNTNIQPISDEQMLFANQQYNYENALKQRNNNTDSDKPTYLTFSEKDSQYSEEQKQNNDNSENIDDCDDIVKLREKRIAELRRHTEVVAELKKAGHGEYTEIVEETFLQYVTKSHNTVVHFYHNDFERCKIVDKHLTLLAKHHFETKFCKINAEKTPFFVQKLQVKVLPSIICFRDGIAVDRIVGFEDLGATDEFKTGTLEQRLANVKMLRIKEHKPDADIKLEQAARTRIQKGMQQFSDHEFDTDSDAD